LAKGPEQRDLWEWRCTPRHDGEAPSATRTHSRRDGVSERTYYSPDDIQNAAHYQEDNFGSKFFVTMPDLQREVFDNSTSGRFAQSVLHVVLDQADGARRQTPGRR
jgi:hypothetical protein